LNFDYIIKVSYINIKQKNEHNCRYLGDCLDQI
jgi:hypothetical protein